MMTKFISSPAIFVLLLALSPCFVFSNPLILTPDNLEEVLAEISARHEGDISLAMNEVEQFLEQSFTGIFDENLLPPEPVITEKDDEHIAFAWPAIAQASSYNTRYLNLESGNIGALTTANPAVNFTLDNHFFMYTFQARSPEGEGMVWIIIHDKPLSIGTTDYTKDCFCLDPLFAVPFNITASNQVAVQAPNTFSYWERVYSFQLSYLGSANTIVDALFSLRMEGTGPTIDKAYFNRLGECASNVKHDQSNIWATDPNLNPPNDGLVEFSFSGGDMRFRCANNSPCMGSLIVTKCNIPDPSESNETQDFSTGHSGRVFPNPSLDVITLYLDDWTDGQQSNLILKNSAGATLEEFHSVEGRKQEINLSRYPSGTYYLQVISEGQSEVYPIVKME